MNQETKWLSDKDLAERFSVARGTIWRWARTGRLPEAKRIGVRCARWDAQEVEKSHAANPRAIDATRAPKNRYMNNKDLAAA